MMGKFLQYCILKTAKPFIDRFPRIASAFRNTRSSWRLFDEPKIIPYLGFKLTGHEDIEAGKYEREEITSMPLRVIEGKFKKGVVTLKKVQETC